MSPYIVLKLCLGTNTKSTMMATIHFFIFCTLAAIPGLIFLFRYNTWQEGSYSHMKATGTRENDKLSGESQPAIHSKEI